MRLVVTIDPNDEQPHYEERRMVVNHAMCLGEAIEDNSNTPERETSDSDPSNNLRGASPPQNAQRAVLRESEETASDTEQAVDDETPTVEDRKFVVNDVTSDCDSDYVPSEADEEDEDDDEVDDEVLTAELIEEEEDEAQGDNEDD